MILKKLTTRLKKKPAETLLEVIIAVFVVALGSASATSLIVSSIQANTFSRDNLVALNLAVEGIEAMRNIRDTNWLKFGFDKTNCWNLEPGLSTGACTNPYPQIAEGTYSVDLDSGNYGWGIASISAPLDLNTPSLGTNDNYRLGYEDTNAGDGLGDKDIFVTYDYITSQGLNDSGESKYYRMIEITYDTSDPITGEVMKVVSTVQWRQNGVHQVQLSTSLANYQKVPT